MTNYAKGRRAEYLAAHQLQEQGYTTIRASGSHGAFDIIAFSAIEVRFVQIKKGAKPPLSARKALQNVIVPAHCKKEMWWYPNGSTEALVEVM